MKPAKLRGMKMPRWLGIVLGVSAALAPLGQTRCATLAVAARACTAAVTHHACCHAPAPARPLRGECCDVHLPPGSLPAGVTLATSPATSLLAALPAAPLLPEPASAAAPAAVPDRGSPPLPIAPGAHGLRAPPLSA